MRALNVNPIPAATAAQIAAGTATGTYVDPSALASARSYRQTVWLKIAGVAIVTTGSAADMGSVATGCASWIFTGRAHIVSLTATATLAATVLILRTAAAGGGTALTAGLTTTALDAANKYQAFTPAALTDVFTAASIYARQTTDSLNAGTADIYIEIQPLS